jgi:hypothetical protein
MYSTKPNQTLIVSWASRVAAPCSKEKLEADQRAADIKHAIKNLRAIGGKFVVYMPDYDHIYPSDTVVDEQDVFNFDVSALGSVDHVVLLDMARTLQKVESNRVQRRKLLSALRRELSGRNAVWMRNGVVFDITEDVNAHDSDATDHIVIDRLYGADVPLRDIQYYYDAVVRHRGAVEHGSGSD